MPIFSGRPVATVAVAVVVVDIDVVVVNVVDLDPHDVRNEVANRIMPNVIDIISVSLFVFMFAPL